MSGDRPRTRKRLPALAPPPAFPICEEPIFIIGSPRSGTSILAMSLAHHGRLWCSHESDLLFNVFQDDYAERAFEQATGRAEATWAGKEQVNLTEFLRYVGLGFNALYTSRSGTKRWIDQTPVNTVIARTLSDLFPGARFLHMLRDSRRVVHSMIHFHKSLPAELGAAFEASKQVPDWATGFRPACQTWRFFVESAIGFSAAHPGRCLTVVNEDLSANPEQEFGGIFRFLDVPHEDDPITFFRSSRLNSSFVPNVWGNLAPEAATGASPAGPPSEPWKQWPSEHKDIFRQEIFPTLRAYHLHTEEQLSAFLD